MNVQSTQPPPQRGRNEKGLRLAIVLFAFVGILVHLFSEDKADQTTPTQSPVSLATSATEAKPQKAQPTSVAKPTKAILQRTANVKLTQSAVDSIVRRGLGATYQQWVDQHGVANTRTWGGSARDSGEGYGVANFSGDYYIVSFVENRAQDITVQFEKYHRRGISLKEAKSLAVKYLPTDSRLICEFAPHEGSNDIAYEYQSNAIRKVFAAADDTFFGNTLTGGKVERDKFTVTYQRFNGGYCNNNVFGVQISTGGASRIAD